MKCAESLRVQAYFDGELDALAAVDIERHGDACAECRAYTSALPALRAPIVRSLEQAAAKSPRIDARRLKGWRPQPFWKGAFSGIAGLRGLGYRVE